MEELTENVRSLQAKTSHSKGDGEGKQDRKELNTVVAGNEVECFVF